jgi:hypothetical protein
MAATVGEQVGAWTRPGQSPADVFVAFGITADPAKVSSRALSAPAWRRFSTVEEA